MFTALAFREPAWTAVEGCSVLLFVDYDNNFSVLDFFLTYFSTWDGSLKGIVDDTVTVMDKRLFSAKTLIPSSRRTSGCLSLDLELQ